MGHNRDYKPEDIAFPDQIITESELVGEMQKSYIEYAMSVIVGRALPDVRDGLKPVHRRILYAMYEDGLTSDKAFKKSATCVGDVLGRYHPHGDASVYDAMVRLAQDFSMRYPLVDGHGNFGSVDGDPPAAYRYTEARMSRICNEMLRDIDKETVNWDPNFDESRKEPHVLPSRFPNLLVNGSSGIAVGMATNIPPHNLGEIIDATICVIDNPNATFDDLMQHVQGPDFPTRGIIMGRSGIRQAYATGRGKITVRARTEFEEYGRDKRERIIVTELPYQVNKRQLLKTIADQVKEKRLDGISDLRDETDRNGMRIVIELKRDANPQVVLNKLFAQTAMQSGFSIIMLALTDDQRQPKILSLRHILDEYIAFQKEIITRRTQFDLRKAQERAHLLEGLLVAQDNIDEVIRIIRSSYDDAKERLMERFGFDDVQAQAILDMRLKALQGLDREKLEAELKGLEEKIEYYKQLLSSEEMLKEVLKEELIAIRDRFSDKRRTEICDIENDIMIEDLIDRENCVVMMSHAGYIKRCAQDVVGAQRRGGKGLIGISMKDGDYVESVNIAHSHSRILFFTNTGKVFMRKTYQIPEASRTAKGTNIVNIIELSEGEKVTSTISLEDFAENEYFIMVTRYGVCKRAEVKDFEYQRKGGKIAINLDEGDELLTVLRTDGDSDVIIATKDGYAVRFNETEARVMGRAARGVRGIRLRDGDEVCGAALVDPDTTLLTVTSRGFGKRNEMDNFNARSRGTKGVICHKLTEKTGRLVGIAAVNGDEDVIMMTVEGVMIRIPLDGIPVYTGSNTAGVILMRVSDGDAIVNFAITVNDGEDETDGEDGENGSGENGSAAEEFRPDAEDNENGAE